MLEDVVVVAELMLDGVSALLIDMPLVGLDTGVMPVAVEDVKPGDGEASPPVTLLSITDSVSVGKNALSRPPRPRTAVLAPERDLDAPPAPPPASPTSPPRIVNVGDAAPAVPRETDPVVVVVVVMPSADVAPVTLRVAFVFDGGESLVPVLLFSLLVFIVSSL